MLLVLLLLLLLLLLSLFILLLLLFNFQIISVYKYPEGPPTLTGAKSMSITIDHSIDNNNRIETLLDENKRMKQQLAEVRTVRDILKNVTEGINFIYIYI